MRVVSIALSFFLISGAMATMPEDAVRQGKRQLEEKFFDQKDQSFWVLRDRESLHKATEALISKDGKWQGSQASPPEYVKYTGEFHPDEDMTYVLKWIRLKDLGCFGMAETRQIGPMNPILDAYEKAVDEEDAPEDFYKIAFLDFDSMAFEYGARGCAMIPDAWVDVNKEYLFKNHRYPSYTAAH